MTFAGNYTDKFDWQKLYGTHRQALEATEFFHVQPEHEVAAAPKGRRGES